MKTVIMNGPSDYKNYSRVDSGLSYRGRPLNGFSRQQSDNLNGGYSHSMNGPGESINDLSDEDLAWILVDLEDGHDYAVNGVMNGIWDIFTTKAGRERRQKRREERRARRSARKEARAERRDLRAERKRARIAKIRARTDKIKSGEGFGEKLLDIGRKFAGGAADEAMRSAEAIGMDESDLADIYGDGGTDERGIFKPKFMSSRWFKKHSPWSYIGTAAAGLIVIDIATGGAVRKAVGLKKK